jgi:predicted nucleic acid-binding protein
VTSYPVDTDWIIDCLYGRIAATALHHDLTLLTRNRRHFSRIPSLRLYERQ